MRVLADNGCWQRGNGGLQVGVTEGLVDCGQSAGEGAGQQSDEAAGRVKLEPDGDEPVMEGCIV